MTTLAIRKLRGHDADSLVAMRSTLDHLDLVDPGQLWIDSPSSFGRQLEPIAYHFAPALDMTWPWRLMNDTRTLLDVVQIGPGVAVSPEAMRRRGALDSAYGPVRLPHYLPHYLGGTGWNNKTHRTSSRCIRSSQNQTDSVDSPASDS
jgi:hypothetical protein